MKKVITILILSLLTTSVGLAQVGVGTTNPDDSAALDVTATDKGFLPPRLTTAQRDAIASPAVGLVVFNTDADCLQWLTTNGWFDGCTGLEGQVATIDCAGATNNGTLAAGEPATGVNSVIAYTGGNGGTYSSQTVTSTGVTGLTATLVAGTFANGAGSVTYTITGTPSGIGTASFALTIGGQDCTLERPVLLIGAISSIDCAGATNNGTLFFDITASGVTSVISYSGGNGGTHNGQVVTSTGVTGLTATLAAGTLATGNGNLTYTITGTPSSPGDASFAINIAGQNCVLVVRVSCNDAKTAIVDVVSATGRTWMDRNLGANRAATSSTDAESYGSLYQWGRAADGHQCVARYAGDPVLTANSFTAFFNLALATTDQPSNAIFIINDADDDYAGGDWRSNNNANRWNASPQVNNPCPTGYRVPTEAELNAEVLLFDNNNASGAFNTVLKLPVAGGRSGFNGSFFGVDTVGSYWTSTVNSGTSRLLQFAGGSELSNSIRSNSSSVRCIKD